VFLWGLLFSSVDCVILCFPVWFFFGFPGPLSFFFFTEQLQGRVQQPEQHQQQPEGG
jgi:hypothetical protein